MFFQQKAKSQVKEKEPFIADENHSSPWRLRRVESKFSSDHGYYHYSLIRDAVDRKTMIKYLEEAEISWQILSFIKLNKKAAELLGIE